MLSVEELVTIIESHSQRIWATTSTMLDGSFRNSKTNKMRTLVGNNEITPGIIMKTLKELE